MYEPSLRMTMKEREKEYVTIYVGNQENIKTFFKSPFFLPFSHLLLSLNANFVDRRRWFKTWYFIVPVVIYSVLYNVPKFFELQIHW